MRRGASAVQVEGPRIERYMAESCSRLVAVIDDDPAVLDSIRLLLEVAGHRVVTYGSAAAFIADRVAAPACLILDHHMPHMTGLDLVAWLRGEQTNLPVLLMTGAPSPAIVARAEQLGIKKVFFKPPTEEDLLSFVRCPPE